MSTYENGAFRSNDNGNSWSPASNGLPMNLSGGTYKTLYTLINIDASLFVGTANGVYKTDDNAITWVIASTGLPIESTSQNPRAVTTLAMIGSTIYAAPLNNGIYASMDKGATWTHQGMGSRTCVVCASGNNLFACTQNY